jgi:hypothetical protein
VSSNTHHARRDRGKRLAAELAQFIRRETPDREKAADVLLGAFEYFERETRVIRGVSPWPPEAGDVSLDLDAPN